MANETMTVNRLPALTWNWLKMNAARLEANAPAVGAAPSFVQTAGVVALKEEHGEVEEMLAEYQRRRDYAVKAINETPGLSCRVPGGAFYIFINIKELGISSADFCQRLLEEEKVAMVPGDVFGKNGEGYLRMSFANSYESVVAGCEGLKRMAAKLMNK